MKTVLSLFTALCASVALTASLNADTTSLATSGVVVFEVGDNGEQRVLPGMSFGSGTRFVTAANSGARFATNGGASAFFIGASSSAGVGVLSGDGNGAVDLLFGRLAGESNGGDKVVRTMMGNIMAGAGSQFTVSLVFDAVSECATLSITNLGGSISYVALLAGEDSTIPEGATTIIRVCEGDPNYAALIEGLPVGEPITELAQADSFFNSGLGGDSLSDETLFAPVFTDDAALTVVSPELGVE